MTEIGANVAQVNEQVSKLERDLARVKNLYKDSVATLEQLQNVTTALNVARQSQSIANFNQQYSDIRATTNGRIVKRIMNEGELVAPGMPVFYLVADNSNDWVVRVGVSDKDWSRLKPGDLATVNIDAFKGETFSARVHKLAPSIDPTSGLYQIELKLQNCKKQLVPGLFSSVKMLPNAKVSYLAIPIEAMIDGNNTSAFVFVFDNGKARKIEIKTNGVQGNEVLISSGLQEGQQVITDGSAYLSDGVDVKVADK
jgi:RND family efflux transporter MFP subunit